MLLASRDVKEQQRNAVIAQAVVTEYDYVCCIDVPTKSYVFYYSDLNKAIVPQTASDIGDNYRPYL